MENDSYVKIIVRDMTAHVRIGLHPEEQEGGRAQRIIINAELYAEAGAYLKDVDSENIIDYARIHDAIKEWEKRPHTLLIETYLKELLELCFSNERITACRVSVTKPDIFPDVERAGVEVFMRREDWGNL